MDSVLSGCGKCSHQKNCIDAFSEVAKYCGAYDPTLSTDYNKKDTEKMRVKRAKDRAEMIGYLSKIDWEKYTDVELDCILRYLSRIKIFY